MTKHLRILVVLCLLVSVQEAKRTKPKGEFLAGTFILTQKSLNEAPYRYAGMLRKALDKAEGKDPPSQEPDESTCDVRYKISPSGKRSKLAIMEDTLSMTLQPNNTIVISAKIFAEVSARTWIWKGLNFGLLGCLKISSCAGQIVTYSAMIDTQVSFQVLWDQTEERLSVKIKPVETYLHNVNVAVSILKFFYSPVLHLYGTSTIDRVASPLGIFGGSKSGSRC